MWGKTQVKASPGVRTIHPPKPFTGHHLEIDTLVPVLRVDKVRQFHGVELFGDDAVEVDKCGGHPNRPAHISFAYRRGGKGERNAHVEEPVR